MHRHWYAYPWEEYRRCSECGGSGGRVKYEDYYECGMCCNAGWNPNYLIKKGQISNKADYYGWFGKIIYYASRVYI